MSGSFPIQALPKDSIFHLWLEARSVLETPISFDLFPAMSAVGAMLKRTCWIDQVEFRIYPNMSVLLVGPSGIGKDTAIDGAEWIIQQTDAVRIVGGKTPETITSVLQQIGDPAAAVIPAGELSEFFGSKDYQQDMVGVITDLLSTKDYKDISLKSRPNMRILRPTLTMLGGSTRDWLHKAMPEEAMSGGFYPRFLIICEELPKHTVAWIKYSVTENERLRSNAAKSQFVAAVHRIVRDYTDIGEMVPQDGAQEAYEKFYNERTKYFSPVASAYAHRCRDTVLRIAMLCAISRFHRYLDRDDFGFATAVIQYVGGKIDTALAPPTMHARFVTDLYKMLPATKTVLWKQLSKKYDPFLIQRSMQFLVEGGLVSLRDKGTTYYKVSD